LKCEVMVDGTTVTPYYVRPPTPFTSDLGPHSIGGTGYSIGYLNGMGVELAWVLKWHGFEIALGLAGLAGLKRPACVILKRCSSRQARERDTSPPQDVISVSHMRA
jgi:hypothetical protein